MWNGSGADTARKEVILMDDRQRAVIAFVGLQVLKKKNRNRRYWVHPILEDMLSLGCKHQHSATIALHVYMELCEVHVLWDVKYFYSQEMEMMYLTARRTRTSPEEVYVPISATANISPEWIDKVQNTLCKGNAPKSIVLAVKDRHSAVVYHHLTEGLVAPDSPNTAKQRKQKEARNTSVEGQLQARRLELYKKAKDLADI